MPECNENSADAGKSSPGGQGDLGGTESACGKYQMMSVGWTDTTDVGKSPAEAFGAAAGTCQATLMWDGSGWDPLKVEPLKGQSEMTVTLDVDEKSARLVKPSENLGAAICQTRLEADAHVELATADGTFKDAADVTLRYDPGPGLATIGFSHDVGKQQGKLSVSGPGQIQLDYRLDGASKTCSGEIQLNVTTTDGHMGTGVAGRFASWSGSGCPVGQQAVALDHPLAAGAKTPLEQIDAVFGDAATHPGTWDDDKQTELTLQAEVDVKSGCKDPNLEMIIVPALATYGTADGRVRKHATDAELRLTPNDGNLRTLELWIDDTLECKTTQTDLAYTLNGCNKLDHVEVQLGVNAVQDVGMGTTVSFTDEGLNAYEYDRQSTAASGAADRVRRLMLGQ